MNTFIENLSDSQKSEFSAEFNRRQYRASVRTMSADASIIFVGKCVDEMSRLAEYGIPAESFEALYDGGIVPNSYKYRGESTYISINGGMVGFGRGRARMRSGASGPNAYLRVKTNGNKAVKYACRRAGLESSGGYYYAF